MTAFATPVVILLTASVTALRMKCIRMALGFMSLLALAAAAPLALGQQLAPDALVKAISDDVIAALKQPGALRDPEKMARLVNSAILPHLDFARTTRIAAGPSWRQATPEQQQALTRAFRTLLVRTYSNVLAGYRNQTIAFMPLHARPGDTELTVRSEIRQPGRAPVSLDYEMEKTADGWKIFDIAISGASLAEGYRNTFAEEIHDHGIEGLIALLAAKNRSNRAAPL
jgi:phospholipid transport system substrate-binding protein